MHATVVAVADEIASAAELASGKTSGRPLVLVRGAVLPPGDGSIVRDVVMPLGRPVPLATDGLPLTLPPPARVVRPAASGPLHSRRMKLGLQISSFTWPGGDAAIGPTLARIVQTADEVGFDSIWVMDHFFQIRSVGPSEEPMLEGFTALGLRGRAHAARAPGPDGRRHPLPPSRASG